VQRYRDWKSIARIEEMIMERDLEERLDGHD
jgi:hypothetical protein